MKGHENQPGMFGSSFGEQSSFNCFPDNSGNDLKAWESQSVNATQSPQGSEISRYDDYYRENSSCATNIDHEFQELGLQIGSSLQHTQQTDFKLPPSASKIEHPKETKKMTWASVASQPAKPQIRASLASVALKKKGPGMPPPPMIPGKHNMDIGTWDTPKNGPSLVPPVPPLITGSPINEPSPLNHSKLTNSSNIQLQTIRTSPTPPAIVPNASQQFQHQPLHQQQQQQHKQHSLSQPPQLQQNPHSQVFGQTVPPTWHGLGNRGMSHPGHPPIIGYHSSPLQRHQHQPVIMNTPHHPPANHPRHQTQQPLHQQHQQQHQPPHQKSAIPTQQQHVYQQQNNSEVYVVSKTAITTQSGSPENNPVLEELRDKNNYNPTELDLKNAGSARFFVIKSYSEDDIHRSIKYEIWCSTEHGNKRLDQAFRERSKENGIIYLLFSVNGSGHFCGMAQMITPVDYNSVSNVWSQDKWKGTFKVKWIYVKDVPNTQLRHIRLENNENKSVTNSRDAQEVPNAKGLQVLKILHSFKHSTSIFDDFIHYEKRQEEEDTKKIEPPTSNSYEIEPKSYHSGDGKAYAHVGLGLQNNQHNNYDRSGNGKVYNHYHPDFQRFGHNLDHRSGVSNFDRFQRDHDSMNNRECDDYHRNRNDLRRDDRGTERSIHDNNVGYVRNDGDSRSGYRDYQKDRNEHVVSRGRGRVYRN